MNRPLTVGKWAERRLAEIAAEEKRAGKLARDLAAIERYNNKKRGA